MPSTPSTPSLMPCLTYFRIGCRHILPSANCRSSFRIHIRCLARCSCCCFVSARQTSSASHPIWVNFIWVENFLFGLSTEFGFDLMPATTTTDEAWPGPPIHRNNAYKYLQSSSPSSSTFHFITFHLNHFLSISISMELLDVFARSHVDVEMILMILWCFVTATDEWAMLPHHHYDHHIRQ